MAIQNSINNQSDVFSVNTGDLTITTGAVQGNAQVLFNSAVFTQFQANQANINLDFKTVAGTGDVVFTPNTVDTLYVSHLGTGRVGLGNGQGTPTAIADIGASTTSNASFRMRSGTAPTSPNNGDLWYDGTHYQVQLGGATLQLDRQAIAGTVSTTGTATTTFTVTIGTTQANTSYKVVTEGGNTLSAAVHYVNNKTTTTFDVVYLTGLTGSVTFDWALFP